MGLEFLISAGTLAATVLFCASMAIFIIQRDKNIIKRLIAMESVIDDLNQQNHKLNKVVKERNIEEDIKKIVENKVEPLTNSLKEVKKITTEYRGQKSNKGVADFEKRVLMLYKEGKNEDEIANILEIGVKQVELILALNNPE
jgi:hypothetical protein